MTTPPGSRSQKSKEEKKPFLPEINGSPRTRNRLQAAISRGSSMSSASSLLSGSASVCSDCRVICRRCYRPKKKEDRASGRTTAGTSGGNGAPKVTPNPDCKGCPCLVESPLVHAQKASEVKNEDVMKKREPIRPLRVSSPLHSIGKQKWIDTLIDLKTTSLPIPVLPPITEKPQTPPTAVVVENKEKKSEKVSSKLPPCERKPTNKPSTPKQKPDGNQYLPALSVQGNASKFHGNGSRFFGKPKFQGVPENNIFMAPSTAPPPSAEMTTLPMVYNRKARKFLTIDPLPGSIFTQCPEPGGWFTVHPDWRREPGIRGMWSF